MEKFLGIAVGTFGKLRGNLNARVGDNARDEVTGAYPVPRVNGFEACLVDVCEDRKSILENTRMHAGMEMVDLKEQNRRRRQ